MDDMSHAQNIRFRVRCIHEGRQDGYGDVHSLRNLIQIAGQYANRELKPVYDEFNGKPKRSDKTIVDICAEYADIISAITFARKEIPELGD